MKGLVLEGGGTKGAYQIGAYKALRDLGIEFQGVTGTSIGALNGAYIIQNDIEVMEDIWLTYDYYPNKVMKIKIFKDENYIEIENLSKEILLRLKKGDNKIDTLEEKINNLIKSSLNL